MRKSMEKTRQMDLVTGVAVPSTKERTLNVELVNIKGVTKTALPRRGLTAAYGRRNNALRFLAKPTSQYRPVKLKVDVGWYDGRWMTMDRLSKSRVLDLTRLNTQARPTVLDALGIQDLGEVGTDPTVLDRMVDQPMFQHLAVVIWKSPANEGITSRPEVRLATLFRGECVTRIDVYSTRKIMATLPARIMQRTAR